MKLTLVKLSKSIICCSDTEALRRRFRVPEGKESLLMFNEETKEPVAYVAVSHMSTYVIVCHHQSPSATIMSKLSSGLNPLGYHFEVWAFSFSSLMPQLTQLYK